MPLSPLGHKKGVTLNILPVRMTHPIVNIIKLLGVQDEVWITDHVVDGVSLKEERRVILDLSGFRAFV